MQGYSHKECLKWPQYASNGLNIPQYGTVGPQYGTVGTSVWHCWTVSWLDRPCHGWIDRVMAGSTRHGWALAIPSWLGPGNTRHGWALVVLPVHYPGTTTLGTPTVHTDLSTASRHAQCSTLSSFC